MTMTEEERIAELLALLPPAPEGWVRAAQQLPRARAGLDGLVARAEADAAFRRTLLADLESALQATGVEPRRAVVDELRRRLSE
ncbi:MAG TPA: hypothetical protein VH950_07720 [Gaiellaceae bacterium]|jgi:hypothetical protein